MLHEYVQHDILPVKARLGTVVPLLAGILLVSAFVASSALAQRKPALPMAEYQTPYYVIHTDLTGDDLKEAALRMTKMAEEYHSRTSAFAGSITQKLPFYLFTREQDYYNAGGPEGSAGVFDPNTLTLMAVADLRADQHTWNTVQHEGFHQFAHAVIGGELPIWVNEGLAEYFGEGVFTGDSFVTGVIRPERLARIKQEFTDTDKYKVLLKAATNDQAKSEIDKGNAFRPVKEMMLLAHKDWNEDLSIVNYDQAWSMVQFLAHGDNGKYQAAFVNFMCAIGKGQQWDKAWLNSFGSAEGFEQRWQGYWNNLPEDPTPELFAKAATATATSLLARATAQKQKFANFDDFVATVQSHSIKIDPQDWLPATLSTDVLTEITDLQSRRTKFTLVSLTRTSTPAIQCTLKNGKKLTGHFRLNGTRVAEVAVDTPH